MAVKNSNLVAWKPQLSADALAHIARLRKEIEPRIGVMRQIRKALRLRQKQVAEALGVTQSNVSKIETTGDPTLSALAKMAEASGMKLRLTLETPEGEEEASFELSSAA